MDASPVDRFRLLTPPPKAPPRTRPETPVQGVSAGALDVMRMPSILTITFAALLTGCFLFDQPIDPCKQGSPLQTDASVKADCEACGQSPCPVGGETGYDEPLPSTQVTCVEGPKALTRGEYCYIGHWDAQTFGIDTAGYTLRQQTADDCWTVSDTFPCMRDRQFPDAIPESGPAYCLACNVLDGAPILEWLIPKLEHLSDYDFSNDLDEWIITSRPMRRLCPATFGDSRYSLSAYFGDENDSLWTTGGGYVWWWWYQWQCGPFDQGSSDGALPSDGSAEVFGYRPQPGNGIDPQDHVTARCWGGDDSACPDGSVCETAWLFVDASKQPSMFPHPSVCTWDDGVPLVAGPEVYGLDAWSDGVVVDGDHVRMTGAFLLRLVDRTGPASLWNDDQAFDDYGVITHCGREALCNYIGLDIGDAVIIDEFDVESLIAGTPTLIEVVAASGTSRWLTVTIDLDGDLTTR